ncbi:beta-galactosidase [Leptospira sp. GIMC2001]|uniref:beta-galactosidase n=1 Tax=Leptospira sp. GIMC2001 TaxID=1513297 RepID=UPI00234931F1|nr:beta-galactosidase [Leptospira sp. GIMC2001]WCL49552.1 beta-galactosidase [Leptospira sp. GIMC2001]
MIFGADYYPEQWTPKDWEEDIKIMKGMGLSRVRLAEFAWALMEPKEGKYDFSFFEKIMDLMYKNQIGVILGTPTATFPPWLYKKYPGIVQVSREGIVRIIGTRRQACFASKDYLRATERIVNAQTKKLGNHPALVGWQIDNEIGHEGSDLSYSPNALSGFRIWLKNKYKSLKDLNHSWGGTFWGLIYNDWNEIPIPGNHLASGFNPAMIQDFYRFNSDLVVHFVNLQTKIIRKNSPGIPITTNLYPSPFLPITDMSEVFEDIDYVSWDNYPVWGPQPEPFPHPLVAATLQYSRGLKNQSFTVMEQFSGQQGHDTLGYLPPPGQIALWMLQAIAHGADQIIFFRYRTALFGQEQLCYGILDHGKQLTHKYFELQKAISDIQEMANDFASEEFPADVAVISDIDNSRNYKHQPLSEGLKFKPAPFANVGYDIEMATWYAGLSILNVNSHFRPSSKINLEDYKVVVLPLYTMFDEEFVGKIEEFVRNGGTLILGYRAGIKEKNHWMLPERTPGKFREMAGIEVEKYDSVGTDIIKMKFRLLPGKCGKFCEILEPKTAKPIAWYNDSRKFYKGSPLATVNSYHNGRVYYIGASLAPESFVLLYRRILRESKIPFTFLGSKIERIFRKGKKFNYEILMNHSMKSTWAGFTRLPPFGYKIKRIEKE